MKNKNVLVPILYILVCIFWGTSWLVIKLSLEYVSPLMNLGLRMFFSSIAILMIMKFTRTELDLSTKSIKLYIILGLFSYSIPFSLVYWAEKTIPSSLASILFGMYPLFIAILSSIFVQEESLSIPKIAGIILAFIGVVFIFKDGLRIEFSHHFPGMIAVITSALFQSSVAITIKKKGGHLNPLSMNFIPTAIATVFLISVSLVAEDISKNQITLKPILMILYLAIFVTVFNFTAYYWLLKRMSVVILSLTSFITPVIAVFVGVVFAGEKFSTGMTLGALCVLLGILIVNQEGIKKFYHQKKVGSL